MEYITLSNGVKMPTLGYGVFLVSPDECERCVTDALSVGYRLIDTAQAYQNERSVGCAVKDSGIDRSEIWITSKLWPNEYGEGKTLKAIDRWHMQMGFSVIPGASNPDYIHENIETFDFALSNHEMERMHQLNKEKRYFNMSYEDQVKWFSQFNPTD